MGKYIVSSGQNIYDISLHIYGSIEGVVDLLMNNESLSFDSDLRAGDELIYTDGFVISPDVVSYFSRNRITPSNGERGVYFKSPEYPELFNIYTDKNSTSAEVEITGSGVIEIDWGDNSILQQMLLDNKIHTVRHSFDNLVAEKRRIRLYGNCSIQKINLSNTFPLVIRALRPIYAERFILNNCQVELNFIPLLNGAFYVDLSRVKTGSLLPLLNCKELMELNLSGTVISRKVLDDYLIALVWQHYGRRNCHMVLTTRPSGEYREPERDPEGRYAVTSGMEAIWLLVNEPAWNEAGFWMFDINGEVYTAET